MSHGPYIETRDSPLVAPVADDGGRQLGPREKSIPRSGEGSRTPGWDTPADLSKDPAIIPDPATTPVPEHLRAEIHDALSRYPDSKSAIIPALWAAQREHGWCSPTAIGQVAAVLQRTPAELMAVATFYDMFETEQVGKHTIYVCTNISCSLRGADELLHVFEEQSAGRKDEFHVRGFECLGACDMAPMVSIDGLFVGPINTDEVAEILSAVAEDREIFPERQVNNRASTDPGVFDKPTHGAAGPQSPAVATGTTAQTAASGDNAPDGWIDADPRRHSSVVNPSKEPTGEQAEERRATGQEHAADDSEPSGVPKGDTAERGEDARADTPPADSEEDA